MGEYRGRAIAHIAPDGREHDLIEHLREVARRARSSADVWGAADHADLAGAWHDLGKYRPGFQKYIHAAALGEAVEAHIETDDAASPTVKERAHSSAGAVAAALRGSQGGWPLAFVIAGHHAGLADQNQLRERLKRDAAHLDEVRRAGAPPELLSREIPPLPFRPSSPDDFHRLELWTRMLFSALCDADFLDTEQFFDPALTARRESSHDLPTLLARLAAHVDQKQATAPATEVNLVRREVREACRAAAERPPGIFTLTVPTGGGKTLASMELGLRHAVAHGLRRVIVAIPYTSIIEQSAAVFRDAFETGEESDDDPVVEHHSTIDPNKETARSRLASQNWDSPIIVTTTVQLFESLFASRTSRCRKLHNLARSVIVLDEAQTMPRSLLAPTLDVLERLTTEYGASLIVSTATQPALGRSSLGSFGFAHTEEVVPPDVRAFERLRRVRTRWPETETQLTWPDLASNISREPDVLAITHRRADARELCLALDHVAGTSDTVHLSALMCAEHRARCIAAIKKTKLEGRPVRVVSTQLVEAGVDLDFPVVYRAMAGLDALAQAAGRCNREGKLEHGELRVFNAPTEPPPGILQQAMEVARQMLRADPSLDLFAPETQRRFFRDLYRTGDTDAKAIQEKRARLQYREVAAAYRVIEDGYAAPIVVPFGRAPKLLAELDKYGPSRQRLRSLQRFIVNVRQIDRDHWLATGAAVEHGEASVVALSPAFASAYDDRFGLRVDQVGIVDPAAWIVDG